MANLAKRTPQEVFDHVCYRMAKQGFRQSVVTSSWMGKSCAYRSEDGLACAAGCCVADDEFVAWRMEGNTWTVLVRKHIVPFIHSRLIRSLQRAHDGGKTPEAMRAALRRRAKTFGLSDTRLRAYAALFAAA
ncbi:MAG: hypothetical protein EPN36_14380 [Rhodanobacteraceae bacterium]|nr:MAG: hypothetical protein EPN36_14380 [Rhodanobacteraceae bacterium]